MSASNPAMLNIHKIFNKLSYEPVVESDSAVKSWINSHDSGVLSTFINGEYQNTTGQNSFFQVKNPFNGDLLAKVVNCDNTLLNTAIDAALASRANWSLMSFTDRGKIIYNIARNVQKNLQLLVASESLNSGRTSREVKDLDIATVIKTLYYYAGAVGSSANFDSYEPVGVAAVIGHYDSPLLSVINKLAAALVTGNTCLLVPNALTPLSCYMLIDLCVQSGVPNGVVNLITSDNDELLRMISRDPRVNCITFDGKLTVGQEIIISQAFIHPSKRTLLSVDGKSSLVIYDSADIDSAVECVVDGCFYANGQHRYSLNKLFIQENVYDDVLKRLEARFNKLKVGNHLDKCNDCGPILNASEFKELIEAQTTEFGAEITQFKNTVQDNTSTLAPPTFVKNVALNSKLNLNEVNGPYLMFIPFRTVKESVELINNSRFGSGVSIHSQNISLAMEVATLLNVGTVWINSFAVERGVQVRKFSGNYKLSGVQSLENFLKPKFEKHAEQKPVDVEEVKRKFKALGSLSPSVLTAENLASNKTYKLYIGGKQARPDTQSSRPVYLPDKSLYCLVPDSSRKDVRNAVEAACSSYNSWSKRANHNKSQILYFLAENFNTRRTEFVEKLELLTKKSIVECEKEVKLCHDTIFYYASVCDKTVGRLNDSTEYGYLMETKDSIGCIAIICGSASDNPLLSFILHMSAAISCGNTVVIVPDETCPVPALDLYEVLETSDIPDGVINILSGNRQHLAKYLVEHQQVNSVWYINDQNKMNEDELLMQQFIKFTSNYSLKQSWLINFPIQFVAEENSVATNYLKEIQKNSVQFKYVHIPMGVIFAN